MLIVILFSCRSSVRKSVDEFNPSCKTTLERRLTLKSGELQCIREKYKDLEVDNQTLKMEVESLKKSLHRMEENVQAAVGERNKLEMEVPSLTAENNVHYFLYHPHPLYHCSFSFIIIFGVDGYE